ncbi:MAG: hypothetical protein C0629_06615, partial [Chromatiales bacterium]
MSRGVSRSCIFYRDETDAATATETVGAMIRWRRNPAILLPTAEWPLQRHLTATAADTKCLSELDPNLAGFDADRIG